MARAKKSKPEPKAKKKRPKERQIILRREDMPKNMQREVDKINNARHKSAQFTINMIGTGIGVGMSAGFLEGSPHNAALGAIGGGVVGETAGSLARYISVDTPHHKLENALHLGEFKGVDPKDFEYRFAFIDRSGNLRGSNRFPPWGRCRIVLNPDKLTKLQRLRYRKLQMWRGRATHEEPVAKV